MTCSAMRSDGGGFCFVHPMQRRVCCFVRARVFPGCLAEVRGGRRHVKIIIRDLKQQSEMSSVTGHRRQLTLISAANYCTTSRRGNDQCPRLEPVNLLELHAIHLSSL